MKTINDLSIEHFGVQGAKYLEMLDYAGNVEYGAGPLRFYGIYISPHKGGRGDKIPIKLPAGRECEATRVIEYKARMIASKTREGSRRSMMPLYFSVDNVKTGNVSIGNISGDISFYVGLGYDFKNRNCNSLTGSILRNAKLEIPSEISHLWGIDNEFTQLLPWEKTLRSKFQASLNQATKNTKKKVK